MTSDQRKTLEALAEHYESHAVFYAETGPESAAEATVDAAAIRAALAEVDALDEALGSERSRVTNLCRLITGRAADNELSNERLGEACREANALRKAKDRLDALDRDAEFTHPQPTLDEAQALAVLMQGAAVLARRPETRETAQRMADAVNALKEHGGRARKATVDALTQQVATLESQQYACHVCGKRIAPGGGSIVIAHDDECRCAATIEDLEARAIPAEWVAALDTKTLWVSLESPGDGTRDVCVRYHDGVATIERVVGTDRMFLETRMPLSTALRAAKQAP